MKKYTFLLFVLFSFFKVNSQITKTFYSSGKLESIGILTNGLKSGEWKWYYESGKLSSWGTFKNGKEDGEWKWYHPNGIIWALGYFSSGQSVGTWKRFDEKGKLLTEKGLESIESFSRAGFKYREFLYSILSIGSNNNNLREGEWKEFNYAGKLLVHCWYKNGKKYGLSKEYIFDSDLTALGNYEDGKREGEWKWLNKLGNVMKSMSYKNGRAHGLWKDFSQDENHISTGVYDNGEKQGPWLEYNMDGYYLTKGYYNKGKLNGECIWYHTATQIAARGYYKNGILTNWWEKYYQNGTVEEMGIVIKENEVEWKLYFENAAIKEQGKTVNGYKEGIWKEFYENGKVKTEGVYTNGIKTGPWKYFYENGNLWKTGNNLDYQEDGEWKFYNENGLLDSIANFSADSSKNPNTLLKGQLAEGLMAYAKNNKIGFMDSTGQIVLSHENGFDYVGRLPYFKDGRCMFIKRQLSPNNRFDSFYEHDGVSFGFIDKNFKVVIPAIYPYIDLPCNGFIATFLQGYSVVPEPYGNKYADDFIIIDSLGQQVLGPLNYSNGCLAACTYYPVITEGIMVADGVARTSGFSSQYDFMDIKSGKSFTLENCTLAGPFTEGIAAVEINYEYLIFVDTSGKTVINKKYYTVKRGSGEISDYHPGNGCDRIGGFKNGKMLIHHFENEGYGPEVISLIDTKGNILLRKEVKGNLDQVYDEIDFEKYKYEFDCDK